MQELFSLDMTTLAVRYELDLQHTSTLRTSNDYFLKQVIKISDAPDTTRRKKPDKFMHIHHIAADNTARSTLLPARNGRKPCTKNSTDLTGCS